MGIQSRVGKETTSAPPAKGRSATQVAMRLTGAGDDSATQTASVAKELLENTIVGRGDDDDAAPASDEDQS